MRSRGPESFWGQMMPHSSATKQLRRRRDELEQWLARGVSEATAKWAVVPAAQGLLQWRGVGWGGSLLVGSLVASARSHMKAKMYISSCPIWFEPPICFALPLLARPPCACPPSALPYPGLPSQLRPPRLRPRPMVARWKRSRGRPCRNRARQRRPVSRLVRRVPLG